ncbi:aminoacetone oxidase family FAD-binding enzyme [Bordetella genomosp. 5]|uniref:TIGR03862 family flavoprotein n=1 Tax=Bordetella genomosp. 5 TaxID=1395608 RepID=UPI000B9EC842|nr:TIGR03862 family flavoprotein [Bordetella genomosp. 5]OZI45454.1 aminoacetone oxidase family FAD-binding enzyme [Bordetella genomosp. 5]
MSSATDPASSLDATRASPRTRRVAVIGGGPAGLMAAEAMAERGVQVDLYDAMPSVGRKFLLAGRGGLNLTHAEALPAFTARYGAQAPRVAAWLEALPPGALREWAHDLGIETFVGTSGRVFPREMKAAPLLRAWLARLRAQGVRLHMRHRWLPWPKGEAASPARLRFATPEGEVEHGADAVVLALGGGSWARLGSDGAWVEPLAAHDVPVRALRPANCGFLASWSEWFRERHAGDPVKALSMICGQEAARQSRRGEFVISADGIEGSLVYALSAPIRDEIEARGTATIWLDLMPDWSLERVETEVAHPRGSRSISSHLQSRLKLTGVRAGLLRELASRDDYADPLRLAARIKALPLVLTAPRPIDEAISTAGGVELGALDGASMLPRWPGVFCAGEMLDWEAPTGGYLLTACMASGRVAGRGVLDYLATLG